MNPEDGEDVIHRVYNKLLRPYLPYKISVHNGIPARNISRLLDLTDEFPKYEAPLISAIRDQLREREDVVLVGGGLGISTVAAVNATGRKGTVKTYEGSANQFEIIQDTIELNKVEDNVILNHAIVGSYLEHSSESYGETGKADVVRPSSLPECDALVLDCEGAEVEILENLQSSPRVIIVETHSFLDSPEQKIRDILNQRGFEIIDRGVVRETNGVFVLTAIQ